MPGLSAFAPRGLMPVAKVRAGHNWADAGVAKKLTRDKLITWLTRSAITVANHARKEAPESTGSGRSWINSTVDDTDPVAYAGIIGPMTGTKGSVPSYMGMIEKGITPHKVSLKHRGVRRWFHLTFGEPEAKPSSKTGFYRSAMLWESLKTFGGIRRERIGGKTAIPWLSRGIKKSLPEIRADLQAIARQP